MIMKSFENLKEYTEFTKYVCEKHKWEKDWSKGGCYIHLEVSEFIEALRGKGDPIDELGDVLFTLLAVADNYKVDPVIALNNSIAKHNRILENLEE